LFVKTEIDGSTGAAESRVRTVEAANRAAMRTAGVAGEAGEAGICSLIGESKMSVKSEHERAALTEEDGVVWMCMYGDALVGVLALALARTVDAARVEAPPMGVHGPPCFAGGVVNPAAEKRVAVECVGVLAPYIPCCVPVPALVGGCSKAAGEASLPAAPPHSAGAVVGSLSAAASCAK
jgi:hypothetical protein